MKKIRLFLIAVASVAGIGGALATTTRVDCLNGQQLYKDKHHITVVTVGYICNPVTPIVTCTYTFNGARCQTGTYTPPLSPR